MCAASFDKQSKEAGKSINQILEWTRGGRALPFSIAPFTNDE